MKKISKIRNKILLHPMMSFIFMIGFIIVLSGILDLFGASITYNKINLRTNTFESTLVTVESLLNLSGIKYIFSNTVANFVNFAPLSMLIISLIGIGIMDKSGFLDTLFFLLTKNVKKSTVTFFMVLICCLLSITGDLCFVTMIPLSALLFKYGKRNPEVGIISSFAALSLGYGMNLFINGIDSSLIEYTESVSRTVISSYSVNGLCYLFIMIFAILIGAMLITYITEKILAPRMGKYIDEEEELLEKEALTRKEKRGLIFVLIGSVSYLALFIYNIIPNVPFGGNLLDYSQTRYIDKLFGFDSFFNSGFVFVVTFLFILIGLLYGLGTKTIENHRDICNFLSHSLDGIGKVIVLILFASMFISLLKYTNIGNLITAVFANIISRISFGGAPLILVIFLICFLTTFLLPSYTTRWSILSGSVIPVMMSSGFSPEFAQLIFSTGSSIAYALTPAMAYFVIYISYMEKYDKNGIGLTKSIKYIVPYAFIIMAMWIFILLLWYFVGIPLGISTSVVL